jgi:RNA polymerase-binding transcription factor DksA
MAKKKINKKAAPKAKSNKNKTAKKVSKPAPKKTSAKAAKKVSKPAPKKAIKPAAKPFSKKVEKKPVKAATKSMPKKTEEPKKVKKVEAKVIAKPIKKAGKPVDAIAKKVDTKKSAKETKNKKGSGKSDDDEEDIPEEVEDDADVDVKDDYEKPEEEEVNIEEGAGLDDAAGLIDLEGAIVPEIDDDEDEVPEKRGRGRRKKNDGKSSGGSMEAYIRNRPLQIDINKPLIKKSNTAAPKPFVNTEDKRSRYSDKELIEFKELILDKLKEAQSDYDLLKQTLSNEDNHGTDDTSPSFKLLEDGSDVMSKEETAQLASRQEKYIVNLKNALIRIENKSYGICRVTGKLIPK